MVYNTAYGLCPSSGIINKLKNYVSETRYFSVQRLRLVLSKGPYKTGISLP
jgi:hypothetical protein